MLLMLDVSGAPQTNSGHSLEICIVSDDIRDPHAARRLPD